jgi:hypothetical protein
MTPTTLTAEQRSDGLVIRTARKPWTCEHWTIAGPGVDFRGRPFRVFCRTARRTPSSSGG